jgi:hypothetical protein
MPNSGTHLTAWTTQSFQVFDATNEIPASAQYRPFHISGGTGFSADVYWVNVLRPSFGLGGQGTHNLAEIKNKNFSGNPTFTGGANGTWSYVIGRTDGDGTFGSNLISLPGQATLGTVYDPDSLMSEGLVGMTISISGTGWTSDNYGVTGYTALAGNPFGVETFFVVKAANYLSTPAYPATTNCADGGTWAVVSGISIPSLTPTPNTAFTGAVKVGLAGDSITVNVGTQFAVELAAAYPNASSRTVTNKGVNGSTADQWARGQTNYNSAVTSFNSAGVTVINIMLGTNNSASTSAWLAAMQSMVAGFFLDCPTVTKVVVQEILHSGASGLDANVQLYNAQLSNIGNGATISTSGTYNFFVQDYPLLLTDGVHPKDPYGYTALSRLWLGNGLMAAISTTAFPPHRLRPLVALPPVAPSHPIFF